MLDFTTDRDTATTTPPAEHTEEQMRTLAAAVPRRSVRTLAAISGWSKSRVARFLSQIDNEASGTTVGQSGCPTPHQFRDLLINGTKDFDNKNLPETAEAAVDRALAEGKVKPPDDDEVFDWSRANSKIAVRFEPALAIYANPENCIVILRDCFASCEDDHFIFFSLERAEAVIEGIRRVMREIGADK